MSNGFDPYREWLGITDSQRPPGLYVLLGLEPFETDADRIEHAILRRTFAISDHLSGEHAPWAEKLLDQIQQAEGWLMNAARKAEYDAVLRESRSTPQVRHGHPSNDDTVKLVEVETPEEAPIELVEIPGQPSPAMDDAVVLLDVAALPPAKAGPELPEISAAEFAGKILRDDVKPQFVPQRVVAVKRPPQRSPQPAAAAARTTDPERPAPRSQHPPERFDALKPMPKAAPTPPGVKVSADAQTLLAQPLLSRTDVAAATKAQLPKYGSASEKRRLSELDVSMLFEAISLFLNRYPKTISTILLLVLVPWLAWRFYPRAPLTAPRQPPVATAAANREDLRNQLREAAEYITLLSNPKTAVGARSEAAERMAQLPPSVIQKFRSTLEDLLETETDEPTKQPLKAALERLD